jgi:hypothetical protein
VGKGARNRAIRRVAVKVSDDERVPFSAKSIARALRKGRLPLTGGHHPGGKRARFRRR